MKFKEMNTPNKLTTIRMFCVPVVILLFTLFMLNNYGVLKCDLVFRYGKNDQYYLTLLEFLINAVFGAASITDCIDGHLARKSKIITNYGKLMDPLADKLLVNTTIICMLASGMYTLGKPTWYSIIAMILSVITIGRDIIIDAMRMQALNNGKVVGANIWGKLKTATLMPGIACLVFGSIFPVFYFSGIVCISIGGIFAIIGGVIYFKELIQYVSNEE